MKKEVLFKPRLNLVLAERVREPSLTEKIIGSVSAPQIIPAGEMEDVPYWIRILRTNDGIGDLKEGQVVMFNERATEINFRGDTYLLVKNEDIFGTDEHYPV